MQTTDDDEMDDDLDGAACDDEAEEEAPAARRRVSRESDALATFQAGKAAYAAGQPETGHPANLHPDRVRDWHDGWRNAATEANQGRGVPVATPFAPAERCITRLRACTYERLQRDQNDNPRTRYPDYPLDMHALIGSTWRNLYTAAALQVGPIRADGWGHPHLCATTRDTHGDPRRPYLHSVGFWTERRCIVEHWVRVDHWTPAERFPWYVVAVAYHRDGIAQAQEYIADLRRNERHCSGYATNLRSHEQIVQSETKHLHAALTQLHAFAAQHGFAVTTAMVNGHPFRRPPADDGGDAADAPQVSEQLALF